MTDTAISAETGTVTGGPQREAFARLERARLRVILLTIAIAVISVVIFSFLPWSNWRTAVALNLVNNTIVIAHAIRHRDRLMWHLILFGFVLGVTELAADAWLVDATRTLDYSPGGGLFIWRSPFWMPLAWEMVAVQFAYIGLRLGERYGLRGLLLSGLLGAVNIPFYEEMALRTHWWRYVDCRMLLHTPYYIILGEFAIIASFGALARGLRRESVPRTIALGVLGGGCIFAAYALAFWITEKLF
jgi:hypothetical protein